MLNLIIDGKVTPHQISESNTSLLGLLDNHGFKVGQIFVKVNDKQITMKNYAQTILQADDKIEIVSLVAGG